MPQPDESRVIAALRAAGYERGEVAGSGGSGVVYRGLEVATGNPVALKLLNGGVDQRRIEREAQALRELDHPGVARLVDLVEADGQFALISEWAEGQSLAHLVAQQGPLAPRRATQILSQLADALDHVHTKGVVHRDLSPDNVMVGANDTVKLIDFGISRGTDMETLTSDGITAGTPRYLAPEVLQGAEATPASDQYSVAVMFYEMVTGRWPYGESGDTNDTVAATLHDHLYSAPTPPSEVNEWLPAGLDPVLLQALHKEPAKRFGSVGAFAEAGAAGSDIRGSGAGGKPTAMARGLLVLVPLALMAVVAVAAFLTLSNLGDSDGGAAEEASLTPPYLRPVAGWSAGTAGSLGCNLVQDPSFAQGIVPEGYYPAFVDRNAITEDGGVGQTRALLVGITDDFAFYGEMVPIAAGFSYLFSANIDPVGELDGVNMGISWLDENFDQTGDELDFALDLNRSGQFTVESLAAPPQARYAVPVISKETAAGYVIVDEVVFASSETTCVDLLRGTR